MKKLLISLTLILSLSTFAQPTIEWERSLGGVNTDEAKSIQQTIDGGYIVAGWSESDNGDVSGNNGNYDGWIVKLNASGNISWQRSLGGSDFDIAESIQQTNDFGYIVAAISLSNDGDVSGNNGGSDYWIVKLDASGNISWQRSLGGSTDDGARSIQQTADGGYIVAGASECNDGDVSGNNGGADYWIAKLDASGNISWQRSLGGTGNEYARSIQQTTDGGYIVAGWSDSNDGDVSGNNGGNDCWIVKLNASGTITWERSLGGSSFEAAYSIQQTTDGGYIVAGQSDSNDGDVSGNNGGNDCWIVKLDASGTITWERSLGGSSYDVAYSIQQTIDGGYIIAGESSSNDGDVSGNNGGIDYWIVQLDASGNLSWQKCFGGSWHELPQSIQQTTDGGYIVAGQSGSVDGDASGTNGEQDYWIVKLGPFDGIEELTNTKKELVNIVDFMGRETEFKPNTPLIFIYSDGTRERVMEIED